MDKPPPHSQKNAVHREILKEEGMQSPLFFLQPSKFLLDKNPSMCSHRSTGRCQCVAQQCTQEKFGEDTRISQVLMSKFWGNGEGKAGWPDRVHSACPSIHSNFTWSGLVILAQTLGVTGDCFLQQVLYPLI